MKIRQLKISLMVFIGCSLVFLALRVFIPHYFNIPLTIFLILLYIVSPLILFTVLEIFLKRLKTECSMLYIRAKVARVYVAVVVILLIARGFSIIMDMVVGMKFDSKMNSTWQKINDIQLLVFYFLENAPSIQIIVTLWRSYKAKQRLTLSNRPLIHKKNSIIDN